VCSAFASAAELDTIREVVATVTTWRVLRSRYRYYEIKIGAVSALAALEARAYQQLQPAPNDEVNSFLLDYSDGHHIEEHVDSNSLQRLNLLVVASQPPGGLFRVCGQPIALQPGDAVVFEPATMPHSVDPVVARRVIWSYGIVRRAAQRRMLLPLSTKVAVAVD